MSRSMRIAVLGAGSWGTTVASLAAANAPTVIWSRRAEVAEQINREHRNDRYLSDLPLHAGLRASASLAEAVQDCDVLVMADEQMAEQLGLVMPISAEVAAVINGERSAAQAFRGLRSLSPGAERDAH